MLQAQGLQPLDPYRTLHLDPGAPRALIDEAYWNLAASANASGNSVARVRVQALNDAYALLTDESRREQYDAEQGFAPSRAADPAPRRRIFGRANSRNGEGKRSFYALLGVDVEAPAAIIALAYAIRSRSHLSQEERAEIDAAHHTLSNRELRAQYDQKLAVAPHPVDQPNAGPPSPTALPPEVLHTEERALPASPAVPAPCADQSRTTIIRPAVWATPIISQSSTVVPAITRLDPPDLVALSGPAPRVETTSDREVQPAAAPVLEVPPDRPEPAVPPRPRHPGILARLRSARGDDDRNAAAAAHARLIALRDQSESPYAKTDSPEITEDQSFPASG